MSHARVLLVEDDQLVADALAQGLRRAHYDVWVSHGVEDALDAFRAHTFDLVITDLMMPGGSGLELLQHFEDSDPSLPVIVITADQSVEAAAGALRGRAFDYLHKPVSRAALVDAVNRALAARRATQAQREDAERLQSEHQELSRRHQRTAMLLSVLYNRAVEGIVILDAKGRVLDASESFSQTVGEPLHQLLERDLRAFVAPHPTVGDIQDKLIAMANAEAERLYWRGDVTLHTANEQRLPSKLSLSVCEAPATAGSADVATRYVVALLYHDQAYEQLSAHLQHADRLATTGLLAGSAAHEIKNELGPILGYLTMLEQARAQTVDVNMLQMIRESVRRVQQHVEEILQPLRHRVRARGPVVLKDSLENLLELLRRAGKLRRLNLDLQLSEDVVVHADKDEIHQIALNLVTNAVDALGDGRGANRGTVRIDVHDHDELGVLVVEDSGEGIADDLKERVFEPFFTTKQVGGTGLGLPVVADIVRNLGGSVKLEDNEPRGTRVRVCLPLYRAQAR